MESIVHRSQPRFEYVRVDLRRREVGVAEHQLNRAQIGAALEEVRSERVAQHMRADRSPQVCLAPVLGEDLPEADAAQRPAARIQEQPRRLAFLQQFAPGAGLIFPYPFCGLLANRHDPFFAALSDAGEVRLVETEIREADVHELRHAQPSGVEQLDQGAVAETARRGDVGLRHQEIDFFDR